MNPDQRTLPFLVAFGILFALFRGLSLLTASFDWTWAQILIFLVVVTGVTIAWSWIRKVPLALSFRRVGFGVPNWHVLGIAVALSALMLAFFPLYASVTNARLPLQRNWPWILIGIIAGVGITEETPAERSPTHLRLRRSEAAKLRCDHSVRLSVLYFGYQPRYPKCFPTPTSGLNSALCALSGGLAR